MTKTILLQICYCIRVLRLRIKMFDELEQVWYDGRRGREARSLSRRARSRARALVTRARPPCSPLLAAEAPRARKPRWPSAPLASPAPRLRAPAAPAPLSSPPPPRSRCNRPPPPRRSNSRRPHSPTSCKSSPR